MIHSLSSLLLGHASSLHLSIPLLHKLPHSSLSHSLSNCNGPIELDLASRPKLSSSAEQRQTAGGCGEIDGWKFQRGLPDAAALSKVQERGLREDGGLENWRPSWRVWSLFWWIYWRQAHLCYGGFPLAWSALDRCLSLSPRHSLFLNNGVFKLCNSLSLFFLFRFVNTVFTLILSHLLILSLLFSFCTFNLSLCAQGLSFFSLTFFIYRNPSLHLWIIMVCMSSVSSLSQSTPP